MPSPQEVGATLGNLTGIPGAGTVGQVLGGLFGNGDSADGTAAKQWWNQFVHKAPWWGRFETEFTASGERGRINRMSSGDARHKARRAWLLAWMGRNHIDPATGLPVASTASSPSSTSAPSAGLVASAGLSGLKLNATSGESLTLIAGVVAIGAAVVYIAKKL